MIRPKTPPLHRSVAPDVITSLMDITNNIYVVVLRGDRWKGLSLVYRRLELPQKQGRAFEDYFGIDFFPKSKNRGEVVRLRKRRRPIKK